MTVVFVLAVAVTAMAGIPPGTQCVVAYDGYLQMDYDPPDFKSILADTLIVVTNSHPTLSMTASIEVFDKYGRPISEVQGLLNGGHPWPNNQIPANGYGWITLSQIVNRPTMDPYGNRLAEKFSIRIYTTKPGKIISPVVEIKQVVYQDWVTMAEGEPRNPIWEPKLFKTWTETSLGGKYGTGIVWQQ